MVRHSVTRRSKFSGALCPRPIKGALRARGNAGSRKHIEERTRCVHRRLRPVIVSYRINTRRRRIHVRALLFRRQCTEPLATDRAGCIGVLSKHFLRRNSIRLRRRPGSSAMSPALDKVHRVYADFLPSEDTLPLRQTILFVGKGSVTSSGNAVPARRRLQRHLQNGERKSVYLRCPMSFIHSSFV